MASHPCPETFQLVRTLRQVSPHGDSFTPSDWPVTGPLAGPLRSVEGLHPPGIFNSIEKRIHVCRYPQTHSFWRLAGILPFLSRYRKILPFAISGHLSDIATTRPSGLLLVMRPASAANAAAES